MLLHSSARCPNRFANFSSQKSRTRKLMWMRSSGSRLHTAAVRNFLHNIITASRRWSAGLSSHNVEQCYFYNKRYHWFVFFPHDVLSVKPRLRFSGSANRFRTARKNSDGYKPNISLKNIRRGSRCVSVLRHLAAAHDTRRRGTKQHRLLVGGGSVGPVDGPSSHASIRPILPSASPQADCRVVDTDGGCGAFLWSPRCDDLVG